jgi:hypothetical protein
MQNPNNLIPDLANTLLRSGDLHPTTSEINREDSIKKDLTMRLKGACEHLSKLDFEVLVNDMTREQLRGESVHGRRIRRS